MKPYKANYISKYRDKNGYAVHLLYEYRGYVYVVTDEHNGYSETMKTKHENEQNRIDKYLDNIEKKKFTNAKDAQEGLDLFFNSLEI